LINNPSKKEKEKIINTNNGFDQDFSNRVIWNKEWKVFANFRDLVDKKL
jgi:hypothetical protein